jgi:hypothetical protein
MTHTAELLGSERGWLRDVATNTAQPWWGLNDRSTPTARALDIIDIIMPGTSGQYVLDIAGPVRNGQRDHATVKALVDVLTTCLRVNDVPLRVGDHAVSSANVELNTALATGNDLVCLAAKIHGWCEIHPWVEETDRAWCADVIERAITAGVYRAGMWYTGHGGQRTWADQGWSDVVALLRDTTTHPGPVVLSYSICDGFPNPEVATTMPAWPDGVAEDWSELTSQQDERKRATTAWYDLSEHDWSALTPAQQGERRKARTDWYDLPVYRRWETAMDGIRRDQPWANIAPGNLTTTTFGPAVTLFDLFHPDRVDRVHAAYVRTRPSASDQPPRWPGGHPPGRTHERNSVPRLPRLDHRKETPDD